MLAAQPAQAFGFDWGVTGGLNLTKLSLKGETKSELKSENRTGWFIGPKVNVGLIAGFGVDGALLYSQRKFNLTERRDGETYDQKTARSLAIPVNLKYSIGLGSLANVFLTTGPQFDFNLGNKKWAQWTNNRDNGVFKQENMTTSWNVGAGAKVLGHLEVALGYNFALGKMGKSIINEFDGADYVGKRDDYRANTFTVQATYYF